METWILWVDGLDGDVYHTVPGLMAGIKVALKNGAKKMIVKKQKKI